MLDAQRARFRTTMILFCADCNRELGPARNETLGAYFICPAEPKDRHHLARVILDERPAKWWLRRERECRIFQEKLSPLKVLFWNGMQAGTYLIVSTAFLLLAMMLWRFARLGLPYALGYVLRTIVLALVLWRFLDIFLTNVSITFTTRAPANPIRSVFFTVVAYVQIALSFALFYLALGSEHFKNDLNWASSVFFSFGTITTAGYFDLCPKTNWARCLVALELVLGLVFLAIIIAVVAGWATSSRREEGEYPIDDLRRPLIR